MQNITSNQEKYLKLIIDSTIEFVDIKDPVDLDKIKTFDPDEQLKISIEQAAYEGAGLLLSWGRIEYTSEFRSLERFMTQDPERYNLCNQRYLS